MNFYFRNRRFQILTFLFIIFAVVNQGIFGQTDGNAEMPASGEDLPAKVAFEKCFDYVFIEDKYKDGVLKCSEVIKLAKTDDLLTSGYYNRGFAHAKMRNYRLAIKDFSKSLTFSKDNYEAFRERAKSYRNLKNYQAAIKDYNQTVSLLTLKEQRFRDGTYAKHLIEAYLNRARVFELMKDTKSAQADIKNAEKVKIYIFQLESK